MDNNQAVHVQRVIEYTMFMRVERMTGWVQRNNWRIWSLLNTDILYHHAWILKFILNLEDEHPLVLCIGLDVIIFSIFSTQMLQWDAISSGVSSVSRLKMINIFITYSRDSLDSTSTIKYRLSQYKTTMKCDWYHACWIYTIAPDHWRDD
jgi:hypothetical protein